MIDVVRQLVAGAIGGAIAALGLCLLLLEWAAHGGELS